MSRIKRVVVYTDTHIGAPHATYENANKILSDFKQRGSGLLVLATGDIFDIKNTKRSEVHKYIELRNALQKEMEKYYIYGNHECAKDPNEGYYQSEGGIMWLHYHVPDWCNNIPEPCQKVKRWEAKKPGLSRHKYLWYRFKHVVINRGEVWKPTDNEILLVVDFAKANNCTTVIFGHTHKLYDKTHDGVRIINAGRGKHVYEME